MKPLTALALISLTPALAGCDILDILTGKPTKAQRQYEAQQAVSLPADRQPDFTELYALSPAPITTDPPVEVAQVHPEPPPAPVYEYDRYNADPAGYVCTAVFRQISCLDDGRPVYLGSQMEQLPFGVHP